MLQLVLLRAWLSTSYVQDKEQSDQLELLMLWLWTVMTPPESTFSLNGRARLAW